MDKVLKAAGGLYDSPCLLAILLIFVTCCGVIIFLIKHQEAMEKIRAKQNLELISSMNAIVSSKPSRKGK